jgi:hypothetical protein
VRRESTQTWSRLLRCGSFVREDLHEGLKYPGSRVAARTTNNEQGERGRTADTETIFDFATR